MRKGGTGSAGRSGKRSKAKEPPPNRHTLSSLQKQWKKEKEREEEESSRPSSASERKLQDSDAEVDPKRQSWSGMRVMDIDKVFANITDCLCCKHCKGKASISEKKRSGCSSVFEVKCNQDCGVLRSFRNCEIVENSPNKNESEINRRLVYASQVIGFKYAGLKQFSALMDLPPPVSQRYYDKIKDDIHKKIKEQAEESMLSGIQEEIQLEGSNEIKVSGDGSWQKRGFSSKNGVVTLIGAESGKVLDIEVLSSHCAGCSNYKGPKTGPVYDEWKEKHEEVCSLNHTGSSGMMEVSGMVRIFKRSEERSGVKYKTYIGDGDAKTFSTIVKEEPYGNQLIPEKAECTGYVHKRMGTRLRKLKKEMGSKKLKDNKTMGGKGRLTDKRIDQLASYYGTAVRTSKTVNEMRDRIWAIWHHYRSTDRKPEHHLCPTGPDSWCKFQKAVATGEVRGFQHSSSIPVAIMDAVKGVFVDLSKEELLKRCVGGYTQNPNESLNALIWKNVPKTVYCGLKAVEIGVKDAVIVFNDGQKGRLKVLKRFGVEPGPFCVKYCNTTDDQRVNKAIRRSLESTKEARKARRQAQKEHQEEVQAGEGPSYEAGGF